MDEIISEKYQIEKLSSDRKIIVISLISVLASVSLIGIFWGKDGVQLIGCIVLGVAVLLMMGLTK